MSGQPAASDAIVARLGAVSLSYGKHYALRDISVDLPAGQMLGLIGPDGVGKSSLLSLIAGARRMQAGEIQVLGGSLRDPAHRRALCQRIAYMPQGLGKNLYPRLTVKENLDFFASLFGHSRLEGAQRIASLLQATGLAPFADRPAAKLSGGMKQKLGLCCALVHEPDLLILDEPTTGVDPLSRRQFWALIERIRAARPGMSLLVATAYMEEAARFDWLLAMNAGRILASGTPQQLLQQTSSPTLEQAFIALLPESQRQGYQPVELIPRQATEDGVAAIEADQLTLKFGDFTAVDQASFRIARGEIFGFIGSNGCGKTTTMKMLTGLLPATAGQAWLLGRVLDPHDLDTRRRVGYMSQSFSLYTELSVRQNLVLHARLFGMAEDKIASRVLQMASRFGLLEVLDELPESLPLGQRQRLSLAVAMIHAPELLILDEPTSGVDPIARDEFWRIMIELARQDGVTIFISTHFMNEAERCDRIALMHAGRVLSTGTPGEIVQNSGHANLEEAFVHVLEEATGGEAQPKPVPLAAEVNSTVSRSGFSLRRLFGYSVRETLELGRDPVRLTLAMLGSALLMLVMGYGISMDVQDLSFAVLDRDQTSVSRDYALNLSGSRYFIERPPLHSYDELDQRMRSGELSLALEIPPGFARDLARGDAVQIGAWIDGAMPTRAETVQGYVQAMHAHWLVQRAQAQGQASSAALMELETRFRYNPEVKSLIAMVPAVIPLLLMLIPAILTALSVVREKELGSIVNLYVTPVTRLEFLLGKQLPYVALSMLSFLMLAVMAVALFQVPLKGSLLALTLGAFLYVISATAMGLVISSFTRSQIAALFATALLTILPAVQFSGMIDPVSSLEGFGRLVGSVYPTTHFLSISRGIFSKGLDIADLATAYWNLLWAAPALILLGAALLRKQEK